MTKTYYPWHEKHWHQMNQARQNDHLVHAFLISGQEFTGKLDFAKLLVKSLLCETNAKTSTKETTLNKSDKSQSACHQCRSCKTYDAKSNPDFLHIDLKEDKQQISIDQIRQMNSFLNLSRSFEGYQVVLISEAERMNKNAANGLLKSLEEPTANSVIILVTSQLSSMLPTIKSRCQMINLPTPTHQQAVAWLQQKTGKDCEFREELEIAQNKPLAALKVDDMLIKSRAEWLNDIVNVIQEKSAITDIAKKWHKKDHNILLNWQISWLYELLRNHYRHDNSESMPLINENLVLLNENIITSKLWGVYDQLLKQKELVHTSVNPLIFLENMLSLWLKAKHC